MSDDEYIQFEFDGELTISDDELEPSGEKAVFESIENAYSGPERRKYHRRSTNDRRDAFRITEIKCRRISAERRKGSWGNPFA